MGDAPGRTPPSAAGRRKRAERATHSPQILEAARAVFGDVGYERARIPALRPVPTSTSPR